MADYGGSRCACGQWFKYDSGHVCRESAEVAHKQYLSVSRKKRAALKWLKENKSRLRKIRSDFNKLEQMEDDASYD